MFSTVHRWCTCNTAQFKSNAIFSHLHNPYDPALAVAISSLNKVEFAMLAACLSVCLACSWWGRDSSWGLDGQQAMCGTMEGYGGINLQGWTGVCLCQHDTSHDMTDCPSTNVLGLMRRPLPKSGIQQGCELKPCHYMYRGIHIRCTAGGHNGMCRPAMAQLTCILALDWHYDCTQVPSLASASLRCG